MKKQWLFLLFLLVQLSAQSQVIFVRNGIQWSVLDSTGKIIHDSQFEKWEPLFKPLLAYAVMKNGKWGVLDLNGKPIIETAFDKIFAVDHLNKKYFKAIKGGKPSTYNVTEVDGGKQGIFDLKGKAIVPVEYDEVQYNGGGYYSVGIDVPNVTYNGYSSGGKWGLLDSTGKVIIQPQYKNCFYNDGIIYIWKEAQKDAIYSNQNGKYFDASKYASVYLLSNSLFIVEKDRKFGVVDFDGKIIIPIAYDEIGKKIVANMITINQGARRSMSYNSQYDVRLDGLWGVCKANGKIVLPMKYEQVSVLTSKLFAVKQNKLWGVVDSTGNIVIQMEYDLFTDVNHGFFMGRKDGKIKWYIFNGEMKKLVPNALDTYYEENMDTKKGTMVIKFNGEYRLLKQDGKMSEPMPGFYLGATLTSDTLYGGVLFENQGQHTYFVSHDLKTLVCDKFIKDTIGALILQNKKWGYINPNGTWLIQPVYDTILSFSEKLTLASKTGNWFVINDKGNIVQELGSKFTHAKSFGDGLAAVSVAGAIDVFGGWQGEKWGYINIKGETIVDYKFDDARQFKNGIAGVKTKAPNDSDGIVNGFKWILINKAGKQINDGYFDEISY